MNIGFDCGDLTPASLILLARNHRVLWKRPLSGEELRKKQIFLELVYLVEELIIYRADRVYIGLTCTDSGGREQLVMLKNAPGTEETLPFREINDIRYFEGNEATFMLPADYFEAHLRYIRQSPYEDVRLTGEDYDLTPVPTSLLVSERLQSLLEQYKARLVLCMHPKFGSHLDTFGGKLGDRISLASRDVPVNEQIMRCSALITDYSSVCWDTLYLRKPVIFYQFDYDRYMTAHGSYIYMRTDLPGYRAEEENEVLAHIEDCLRNNCTLSPEHAEKADAYFAFRDQDNCRRTYEFIAGMLT